MIEATRLPAGVPVCDVDPFAHERIRDPYGWFGALRALGPMAWFSRIGVWGTGHYDVALAILGDPATFCSSAGVGLTNFHKEKPWRPPSLLLEADPPEHTRRRATADRVTAHGNLRRLRPMFEHEAAKLVEHAVAKGRIDGVADIAKSYIVEVLPNAVGLAPEGRENLLPYGDMVFNGFGPRNDVFDEAMRRVAPVTDYIMHCCERRALTDDGLGAQVYAAVEAGEISEHEALFIVRSLLGAGLDTTVDSIGNALNCFAAHPDQWAALRREPTGIRNAIEEVLRYDSPFQILFRTTTRAVDIGGVRIGDDEKVMIAIGAANRDPAKWAEPERFDIARDTSGHLGFGLGIHNCLGQSIARLEMQVLFTELARRVARIEPCGPAPRRLNNTLHGFAALPLTLHPA